MAMSGRIHLLNCLIELTLKACDLFDLISGWNVRLYTWCNGGSLRFCANRRFWQTRLGDLSGILRQVLAARRRDLVGRAPGNIVAHALDQIIVRRMHGVVDNLLSRLIHADLQVVDGGDRTIGERQQDGEANGLRLELLAGVHAWMPFFR